MMTSAFLQKTVFLDRDGVINEDSPNYIKNWSEFFFIPGSIEAVKLLTDHKAAVFLITNQSIIHRKMAEISDLEHIHQNMLRAIEEQGGTIRDIFFCPHTPDEGCRCRKPKPGLIHKAQALYHIDLNSSCMVGDYITDLECARNAGVKYFVLVRTGRGRETEKELQNSDFAPDYIADDLLSAVNWILTLFSNFPSS